MQSNSDAADPDLPLILLASDEPRLAQHLCLALREQSVAAQFAPGYREIESLTEVHKKAIVLLEVSGHHSVEAAVEVAKRIKRSDPGRFVAYLADRILHSSGLAGDAIFPRTPEHLIQTLRVYFAGPK